MDSENVPVFSGGILKKDATKLAILPRGEVILTNEQAAKLLAAVKSADSTGCLADESAPSAQL